MIVYISEFQDNAMIKVHQPQERSNIWYIHSDFSFFDNIKDFTEFSGWLNMERIEFKIVNMNTISFDNQADAILCYLRYGSGIIPD